MLVKRYVCLSLNSQKAKSSNHTARSNGSEGCMFLPRNVALDIKTKQYSLACYYHNLKAFA